MIRPVGRVRGLAAKPGWLGVLLLLWPILASALDPSRAKAHARLVLVDAMELAWQRAKYRGQQHPLLSADPGLVGLNTLQHWLWQRLQATPSSQVAA